MADTDNDKFISLGAHWVRIDSISYVTGYVDTDPRAESPESQPPASGRAREDFARATAAVHLKDGSVLNLGITVSAPQFAPLGMVQYRRGQHIPVDQIDKVVRLSPKEQRASDDQWLHRKSRPGLGILHPRCRLLLKDGDLVDCDYDPKSMRQKIRELRKVARSFEP